jgi:hypothetical protein
MVRMMKRIDVNMKFKLVLAIMLIVVVTVLVIVVQKQSTPPLSSDVQLVSYEWDVKVVSWEHEYVEANITLLNSGNGDAKFTLEISLYDDGEYFGFCKLWPIELAAGTEETFTKHVPYELLCNHHHANAIEIICGIYGEDDCLQELCFSEFSSKEEN